jgi:hypothetical protein
MAGLFRRFRRNKVAEVEPEPEPAGETDEGALEAVPEDGYVATEGTDAVAEPEYDPTAVEAFPESTEPSPTEEPVADAAASPEFGDLSAAASVEVSSTVEGAPGTAPELAPAEPAIAEPAVAPSVAPSSAVPVPRAVGPASVPLTMAPPGPRLPAPGAVPDHDVLSMPAQTNCFLCGQRLGASGYCPSCQMTWVE